LNGGEAKRPRSSQEIHPQLHVVEGKFVGRSADFLITY
jgi:hypothetical protein